MGDNQILFCQMLEDYCHVFQRNVKVDCIFNNLTLICFKSGGTYLCVVYDYGGKSDLSKKIGGNHAFFRGN